MEEKKQSTTFIEVGKLNENGDDWIYLNGTMEELIRSLALVVDDMAMKFVEVKYYKKEHAVTWIFSKIRKNISF